jgi:predicted CoA-binding protein
LRDHATNNEHFARPPARNDPDTRLVAAWQLLSVTTMASCTGLESFLAGHRIAFIGVSTSPTCPTRQLFRGLVARGHDVIPIRPGVAEIEGIEAHSSLHLAGEVDGAVIMMSRRNGERALDECRVAGVRRVWLIGDDVGGAAAAFAAENAIELVISRDPLVALDLAQGLLRRLTGRLKRITSITQRVLIPQGTR